MLPIPHHIPRPHDVRVRSSVGGQELHRRDLLHGILRVSTAELQDLLPVHHLDGRLLLGHLPGGRRLAVSSSPSSAFTVAALGVLLLVQFEHLARPYASVDGLFQFPSDPVRPIRLGLGGGRRRPFLLRPFAAAAAASIVLLTFDIIPPQADPFPERGGGVRIREIRVVDRAPEIAVQARRGIVGIGRRRGGGKGEGGHEGIYPR
mmetsp:Transcript_13104/g.38549  ORF Transcript_13104/g.38549 Transcript_13104/m.38549 type:complete len:205 (+) Transcript_13104:869-1483(+)